MPTLVGKEIGSTGLGLMRFTLPTLDAGANAGANGRNAADLYGTPDHNSLHLLQRFFSQYSSDAERVVLSVKSGVAEMRTFSMDSSPAAIWQSETVAALKEQVEEGKIGGIQLSEVHSNTIIPAHAVAKVDMVEAEISLWATDVFENGVAKTCAELGIVMEAHTPLGAGMLAGRIRSHADLSPHDYHRQFPRFQPENLPTNLQLVEKVDEIAKGKGCTPAQLALSWLRTRSGMGKWPTIIPLPGARTVERVRENNTHVPLSRGDMEQLDDIHGRFPVTGGRYPAAATKLTEY
ncbi:NADP-dependent oxidoreductase domain-containing protein [Aspergillus pseudotamarii]|uniref:NADP-dependent oxidoreductase domain-containing protein n=1 Tax=Aspergillus pseudotamarii TaxID=132259 RepID=A0A5N6SV46_ASPPS|nr:NADP-dependent oxidoreductase domain-containing protein [Aspergillus pseudotamarii]KAE8138515.1 NADP-dependent oxidoreductase domain-containing protein [Aspergillus pseudotamarii]